MKKIVYINTTDSQLKITIDENKVTEIDCEFIPLNVDIDYYYELKNIISSNIEEYNTNNELLNEILYFLLKSKNNEFYNIKMTLSNLCVFVDIPEFEFGTSDVYNSFTDHTYKPEQKDIKNELAYTIQLIFNDGNYILAKTEDYVEVFRKVFNFATDDEILKDYNKIIGMMTIQAMEENNSPIITNNGDSKKIEYDCSFEEIYNKIKEKEYIPS